MLQRVHQSHIDAGAHAPFLADAVDDLRQQAEDLRAQITELDDQITELSGSPNPARELSSGNASSLTVSNELSDDEQRQLDALVEERIRLRDQAFELETAIGDANTSWFEKLFGQADGGFHAQSDAAGAISTASDTLDAAIADAQTQRDALQAQYDALQQQISALWTQADAICSQMYELDQAIGDAAGEIGSTGVTVQVYSRGASGRRAEGDDQIRRQLEELDRQKGEASAKMEVIEKKWGIDYGDIDALQKKRDEIDSDLSDYEDLAQAKDELNDQMEALFEEAPDINPNDFENY